MKTVLTICLVTAFIAPTHAHSANAPDPSKASAPSTADRETMAAAHEKMATCLRSNKDLQECHNDLRAQCQATMGSNCPGLQMGPGMGKGIRKGMKR